MKILLIASLIPFVVSIPDPHIKKTDANGNLHVHFNVPELGPVEHLRLNKVTQPRQISRGSTRNRAGTPGCPPGYERKWGHILGGQEGKIKNTDMKGCSDRCNENEHCCSFEYSQSRNVCNLHRYCQPRRDEYSDYRFCVKKHVQVTLISGGDVGGWGEVEIFSPRYQCELRSPLPEEMEGLEGHTSDGMTLCGGTNDNSDAWGTSCITLSSDKWVTSHALAEERMYHTSWNIKEEGKIILMGGAGSSGNTTEIITEAKIGGVPGFRMKYETESACSIADHTSNTVIITGGRYTLRTVSRLTEASIGMPTVSRYSTSGHLEDLPPLNQGRYWHGCGAYIDNSGNQVLLVAGGLYDHSSYLSSTEKLSRTSSAWLRVANLPRKMFGVRGVTLDNTLYMTGGSDRYLKKKRVYKARDEIYQWTGRKWKEVAKMKNARYGHAVSTIRVDEIEALCR